MSVKIIRRPRGRALFALATLCAMSSLAGAAPDASMRFHTGLRYNAGARRLSEKQLQTALESLRHKTGFLDMRFDEAGYLKLGDRNRLAGGSGAARELLTILHELAHGVLGLKDDIARGRLGECHERINLIRRDLGLPERRYYSPAISLPPARSVEEAELIFALVGRKDGREKTKVFYLRWDAKSVAARESQTAKTK